MSVVEQVREAGVIGAGGAGFPTHVKLDAKAEYILLNAAECEPLLRVDESILHFFPDDVLKGFEVAGHQVGAKQGIIGIKSKHESVIKLLHQRLSVLGLSDYISIHELPDVYPMGDEQVLVYELTGRVVPEAGIPLHVGCVVINVETAYNVHRSVAGNPVVDTFITVAGDIPHRVTVQVPVGTPLIDVLRLSGIEDFSDYSVIDGGPMMGNVLYNLNGYVTKKSKGYLILKKDSSLIGRKTKTLQQATKISRATCEQCRLCTDLCPRYLLGHNMQPHKTMRTVAYQTNTVEEKSFVQLCCECNVCELFACPVGLYPRTMNVMVKNQLAQENVRYQPRTEELKPHTVREYRYLPSKRLIAKLGLTKFNQPAPFTDVSLHPSKIRISTIQHIGKPAIPKVQVGDKVVRGQLIGEIPPDSLGATAHASMDGTVTEVTERHIEIEVDYHV